MPSPLGRVRDAVAVACPQGAPAGSTCTQITVVDCPTIETEAIEATLAVLPAAGAQRGTIVHLKGGGGEGWETIGTDEYRAAGFVQIYVSWTTDWEQTASHGIKTAACRPATTLQYIFDELHTGARTAPYCAQGKSGGSGQLGYALAHYGAGSILDYVNELAGPPFSRIDLGCDGDAPATAEVCGDTVTTRLPDKLTAWENMTVSCGSTNVPVDELARWKADSIAVGGTYQYPQTRVEFFDCMYNAPAVAAFSKVYFDEVALATGDDGLVGYHCYHQSDRCQGESLGAGEPVAIQSMIDGCTPRH